MNDSTFYGYSTDAIQCLAISCVSLSWHDLERFLETGFLSFYLTLALGRCNKRAHELPIETLGKIQQELISKVWTNVHLQACCKSPHFQHTGIVPAAWREWWKWSRRATVSVCTRWDPDQPAIRGNEPRYGEGPRSELQTAKRDKASSLLMKIRTLKKKKCPVRL